MDSQTMSEWLASLSTAQRMRALALLHSALTVEARQFFLPGVAKGREQWIINVLHGINELHHTVANLAIRSQDKDHDAPYVCARQLIAIASQYGIEELLSQTVDFVHSRKSLLVEDRRLTRT